MTPLKTEKITWRKKMKIDHNNLYEALAALNKIAQIIEDRDDLPVDFSKEILKIIREAT